MSQVTLESYLVTKAVPLDRRYKCGTCGVFLDRCLPGEIVDCKRGHRNEV